MELKTSIYCPFCFQHTSLTVTHTCKRYNSGAIEVFELVYETEDSSMWWIALCNNCNNVLLVKNKGEKVYPEKAPTPTDERIPDKIRLDLEEAKICFAMNCYRACAVIARRSIQTACIEKGANKEKLVHQIDQLFDMGVITKDLRNWAHLVRMIGNDAAHPKSEPVDYADAQDVLDFAEQFMYVVFVTPKKAEEQSVKRNK